MSIEWDKVGMLLHIIDKSKDHPKLASLTNAALAELDEHAAEAKKANDLAAKEKADKAAAEAQKHVEEVRKAEEERLAKEEEAIKARPPGKTPAELQAEAEAARAVNDQARAEAAVKSGEAPKAGLHAEPEPEPETQSEQPFRRV